ncbi:sensor histidine kinase [Thermosporothrix hazakensis]|nr:HAMP domain-containing sensor histidine kinase [Thermosporothrix hazakensis]
MYMWFFSRMRKPMTLRSRLILWNVVVLVLAFLVLGVSVYLLMTYYLQSDLDKRLTVEGDRLQSTTSIWLAVGNPFDSNLFDRLARTDQGDEFTSDPTYIKLFDIESGRTLRRSPNLGQERLASSSQELDAALRGEEIFKTYRNSGGEQVRMLTIPLRDDNGHVVLVAQVGQSLKEVEQVRTWLATFLIVGSICTALIAYTISFLLTTRELKPLRVLSTTMSNLSAQGLGTRLASKGQTTEVRLLTKAFNQMMERLEASFSLQRNFVADVSHELRTPLTSIRGEIDVLLLNPELGKGVREDILAVRTELERLSRLVRNLLLTARAEVGVLPQPPQQVQEAELDILLIELTHQARFLNQQVNVELEELEQCCVYGDADLLRQLFLNILDNAMTYTRCGGSVRLQLRCTEDAPVEVRRKRAETVTQWAEVTISDTGPGIAPDDLPHIFERHFRGVHTPHTTLRSKLGSGLGLSIALLIAESHGGTITVDSELGKGSQFHVWLPACETLMAARVQK